MLQINPALTQNCNTTTINDSMMANPFRSVSRSQNANTPLRAQSLNNPFAFESPSSSTTMFSPLPYSEQYAKGTNISHRLSTSPHIGMKIFTPQPSQSSSPVSIESTSPLSSPRVRALTTGGSGMYRGGVG